MRHLALQEDQPIADLNALVEEYLAECTFRNLSPKTVEWYRYCLGPFARHATDLGIPDPESVTEEVVREFLSDQSRRVAPRRVNHYRQAILRFFRWLEEERYVNHNPAERLSKLKEPKKLIPTFTEDEMRRLLSQPDRRTFLGLRDYVFMLLLLDTGARLSEALGLRLRDVDFSTATLRVMGKGAKERIVGFSADLERRLRHYLKRREAALKSIRREDCEWLFPSHLGTKGGAKGFQMALNSYGEEAGIKRVRVSPHTFRHTFAVWFVRKGGSPFHLQKILGHATLDMSRRYCELADVDFIERQKEFSPLVSMGLAADVPRRLK